MIAKIFNNPFKFLSLAGFWFDKKTPKALIAHSLLMHITFIEIPLVLTIVNLFTAKNAVEFSTALEMVPFFLGLFFKSINIIYNKKKIENLLETLKELIDENSWIGKANEKKLRSRVNQIDRIFKICVIFVLISIILRIIGCIVTKNLLFKMRLPYDYQNNLAMFWFILMHQSISGVIYLPVLVICDFRPIFFICFATGITEELNERIKKMLDNADVVEIESETVAASTSRGFDYKIMKLKELNSNLKLQKQQERNVKEFQACIDIHQGVKNLAAEIQNIFGTILGIQGTLSVLLPCAAMLSLTVLEERDVSSNPLVYIFSIMVQVFLPCYFGNQLLVASETIASTTFHLDWIDQSKKFKTAMKIFMENTKKPIKISAFGIFHVTLETFLFIVNSSYSMYTLLKTVIV